MPRVPVIVIDQTPVAMADTRPHPFRLALFPGTSDRVSIEREPLSYLAFFAISFAANFIIILGLII